MYNISCILELRVSTKLSVCLRNYQCDYRAISVSVQKVSSCQCSLAKGGLVYNTSCILVSYEQWRVKMSICRCENRSSSPTVYMVGVVLDSVWYGLWYISVLVLIS